MKMLTQKMFDLLANNPELASKYTCYRFYEGMRFGRKGSEEGSQIVTGITMIHWGKGTMGSKILSMKVHVADKDIGTNISYVFPQEYNRTEWLIAFGSYAPEEDKYNYGSTGPFAH